MESGSIDEEDQEQISDSQLLIAQVRDLVIDGKYAMVSRWEADKLKQSRAWTTFYNVQDENGEIVRDIVCCINCKKVYKHVPVKGTSTLLKHQDACLKLSFARKPNENPTKINRYQDDLTSEDKLLLKKACSELVIRDLRPLNALSGDGLNALLKAYAYICMKYSGLQNDPMEYLPSPDTVARYILTLFEGVKIKLKPILNAAFSTSEIGTGAAICLDIWTDEFRKISDLGVTVHFIDNAFTLHSRVIDNRPLKSDQSKTGKYLLEQIKCILNEYDIDIESESITFVTDRGANVIKALEKYCRHNDGPHFLHNTVKLIFLAGCPLEMLSRCKELVGHIKHAGLNDLFSPSLKSYVETRWNTVLGVFESIEKNWEKLIEVLTARNELEYLNHIRRDDLKDMIIFLTTFREATLHMESSKTVTLFWCCVFFKILAKHLEPSSTDSALIAEAKHNCAHYYFETLLSDKMIQVRHLLSVFLHPSLKRLNKMTPIEQRQIYQEVSVLPL